MKNKIKWKACAWEDIPNKKKKALAWRCSYNGWDIGRIHDTNFFNEDYVRELQISRNVFLLEIYSAYNPLRSGLRVEKFYPKKGNAKYALESWLKTMALIFTTTKEDYRRQTEAERG